MGTEHYELQIRQSNYERSHPPVGTSYYNTFRNKTIDQLLRRSEAGAMMQLAALAIDLSALFQR